MGLCLFLFLHQFVTKQTAILWGVVEGIGHPFFLVAGFAIYLGALFVRFEKSAFEERSIRAGGIPVGSFIGNLVIAVKGHCFGLLSAGNGDEDSDYCNNQPDKKPVTFIYFHSGGLFL